MATLRELRDYSLSRFENFADFLDDLEPKGEEPEEQPKEEETNEPGSNKAGKHTN